MSKKEELKNKNAKEKVIKAEKITDSEIKLKD